MAIEDTVFLLSPGDGIGETIVSFGVDEPRESHAKGPVSFLVGAGAGTGRAGVVGA